ncbi:MAG: hypothetical protein RBR02_07230 [Desulfuromonadaceae bacterium]|nr:hypothetical protein [Desulfuromonadaceae bacterium]
MAKKEKLLATAQKCLQKNQVARAIKLYEKALSLDEKDFRCRQKLAELYSRNGEVDKATTHYEKVATHYEEHTFYLKAIAVYKQMQRLEPENDVYTLKLAKLNEQQGLVGNALAEYRTLLKLYEVKADIGAAIDTLKRIRKLDSENVNAAVRLAKFYAQLKLDDKAHETFAEVEEQLWQKGNYKQLRSFYEHFIKLWPEDVLVMAQYGHAMVEFGEVLEGVEYLTGLCQQHPDTPKVLDHLAAGLHKSNEYQREIKCLQQWSEMEPENLDIYLRLCKAALAGEDTKTCVAVLEKSREKFFAAQRVEEIKPLYEHLREALPDNDNVVTALRAVYEHLGEGEKLFDTLGDLEHDGVDFNADETKLSASVTQERAPDSDDSDISAAFDEIDFDDLTFDTVADAQGDEHSFDSFDIEGGGFQKSVDVSSELEEVDFYLQQGLLDEAQEACERLLEQAPDNAEVLQRLDKIQQFNARHAGQDQQGELEQATLEVETETGQEQSISPEDQNFATDVVIPKVNDEIEFNGLDLSLDDGFDLDLEMPELADSQRGVVTEIGDEDTESAYNLGIAYKEMALYSDALLQFNKAMADPARKIACISLQADCYRAMQLYEKAEEVLTSGLSVPGLGVEERIALYYETGLLYEESERHADALASYQVVADNDPGFRDVSQKIIELKKVLGIELSSDDISRVSYV